MDPTQRIEKLNSKIKGLVVVNVITADGVKTSLKVIANQ